MAATNAPWDIDNAFLRAGRLDLRLYVGPPKAEALVKILKLFLRNRPVSDAFQSDEVLRQISEKLEGFTGADIELLTDRAALLAFREAKSSGTRISITPELILDIAKNRPRSVTPADEKKYLDWQKARGTDFLII